MRTQPAFKAGDRFVFTEDLLTPEPVPIHTISSITQKTRLTRLVFYEVPHPTGVTETRVTAVDYITHADPLFQTNRDSSHLLGKEYFSPTP